MRTVVCLLIFQHLSNCVVYNDIDILFFSACKRFGLDGRTEFDSDARAAVDMQATRPYDVIGSG